MKKVLLQELEYLGGQLREESIRCDRLEEQMNDLTELHQVSTLGDVDDGGVGDDDGGSDYDDGGYGDMDSVKLRQYLRLQFK